MITVYIGQKFDRWTVISIHSKIINHRKRQLCTCVCQCGKEKEIRLYELLKKKSKSCGCRTADRSRKHGQFGTRTYRIWSNMIRRCDNEKHVSYKYYGARGIKVCNRWYEFINFFTDMGTAPANRSLDRIDNNTGYSKDNCRWVDRKTQARNTRRTRQLTYNGQTKCLTDWANEYGLGIPTLIRRLAKNWTLEKALLMPQKKRQ